MIGKRLLVFTVWHPYLFWYMLKMFLKTSERFSKIALYYYVESFLRISMFSISILIAS